MVADLNAAAYKPIPVAVAATIAGEFDKSQVLIFAWDPVHQLMHSTSFGVSPTDKIQAAQGVDAINEFLGTDMTLKQSYEDFRYVDQAEAKAMIDKLREQKRDLLAAMQHVIKVEFELDVVRTADREKAWDAVKAAVAKATAG